MVEPPKMELLQSKSTDSSVNTASGVKLSELTQAISENYNKYHQVEQQLKSIQEWIVEQERVYNGTN